MKNSKVSDRELARRTGVSQPTVSRRRAFLEEELSLHYTVIPDFAKLGMEIMLFHFVQWKSSANEALGKMKDYDKRVDEFLSDHPNIVFISGGQGCGMSRIVISIHKDYSEYVAFKNEFDEKWGQHAAKQDTFIVSLKSDQVKRPLSLRYLADYMTSIHNL
jgi:DNA-binding Lrp family transcriptional regulator